MYKAISAAILATLISANANLAAADGKNAGAEPAPAACTSSADNPDCAMTLQAAQDSAGAAVAIGPAGAGAAQSGTCGPRIYPDCPGGELDK